MSEWDGFHNEQEAEKPEEVIIETMPAEDSTASEAAVEDSATSEVVVEEAPAAEVVVESVPVEETAPTDAVIPYNNNPYDGQMPPNGNQGSPYNPYPYNNNSYNNPYNNNPYNNNPYNNTPYNNNPYNNNPNVNNTYNNNQYNNNPYGGNPYNSNQYNNAQYNNTPYGNQGSQYNNNPYNNNQYGNNPYSNQYGNNPYSPYAMPPKKNKNGLIIGIVIGIIVLFLIAVFALSYRAIILFTQDNDRIRNDRDEYQFDDRDDWGTGRGRKERDPYYDYNDDDDDDDRYDDYDYDNWYDHHDDRHHDYDYDDWYDDYNYDDDSPYYELHDDVRTDLSYSVEWDYYESEMDSENVDVWSEYPIIHSKDVPNLDRLNNVIKDEVYSFEEFFKEEYEPYITEDDYYEAYILGYVTYMDEDKMSIVFDERIYSYYYDDYSDVYLCCINIDMKNGVVLDNKNILNIDDDFSVDFRERSDIQNGESYYVSMMTDQEITDYFNSKDIIVFYTPMGMEIGFNYEQGWITVTYSEYEQYLKVF